MLYYVQASWWMMCWHALSLIILILLHLPLVALCACLWQLVELPVLSRMVVICVGDVLWRLAGPDDCPKVLCSSSS